MTSGGGKVDSNEGTRVAKRLLRHDVARDRNPPAAPWLSGAKEKPAMTNEGTADRVIRVVLGLGLLSITMVGPQTPWGYVGLVPLATGILGFCPLYRLVGVNTCKVPAK
jgi:hypothetical protein